MTRRRQRPLVDLETHEGRFVSVRQLADYLPCDERRIRRMITAGALGSVRVGREYWIPIEDARAAFVPRRTSSNSQ